MSTIANWLLHNGHNLLETAGILGGLIFTSLSFRNDTKSRKVATLISLTAQHRDIWEELYSKPELRRVLDAKIEADSTPTVEERKFVNSIILQAHCVFRASELGELITRGGLAKDIGQFFSLPLPANVWGAAKRFHDADFVDFIESSRDDHRPADEAKT